MTNNTEYILEIKNASVIRKKFTILDNINLKIKKNEHTAILGPNGSGKTSLLKLITRDYFPGFSKDTFVKLFGETVWDLFELRKKIGIVSDNLQKSYNQNCSGKETILSGFFGSTGIFSVHNVSDIMHEKAIETMKFLGIQHLAEKKLSHMSSGEINRFFVGRALVNEPEVLILDEPTSNLDIKSTHIFLSYIQKIAKKNTTVIMVTHHIHDIIPCINKIIMMKNNKIYKHGYKEDLLKNNVLSSLFDFDIEIFKKRNYYYFC